MPLTTQEDLKQLGTILSIWAHPDDETFACAGIMAAAVRNGQKVICITVTRGEAGTCDQSRWPAEQLGRIRDQELQAALNIIGVTEHFWLGYPDGGCNRVSDEEAIARLASYCKKYSPDTILTFGADGLTGHDDHKTVSRWACEAANRSQNPTGVYGAVERRGAYNKYLKAADRRLNIYFNIDRPVIKSKEECEIYFELSDEMCLIKRNALTAMPSQTEELLKEFPGEKFSEVFCAEAFVRI